MTMLVLEEVAIAIMLAIGVLLVVIWMYIRASIAKLTIDIRDLRKTIDDREQCAVGTCGNYRRKRRAITGNRSQETGEWRRNSHESGDRKQVTRGRKGWLHRENSR